MELQTIGQVSKYYGISMQTVRYYERAGLIQSIRKDDNAYRFYDETAVKRLHSIIVLRKLRVSVKQISDIFNNQNAAATVAIFEQNISELDEEIMSLSAIKSILTQFAEELRVKTDTVLTVDLLSDTNTLSIISSISFSKNYINNVKESITMEELNKASEKVNKLYDVRVIYIPPMTVAASYATGENCEGKAIAALNKFVKESGLLKIKPDVRRFGFDCSDGQTGSGEASHGYEMWVSVPDDITVPKPLIRRAFHGGLYAAHMIKMGDFDHWNMLREWVNTNGKYLNDWGSARWTPFIAGMEHCLEESLNYWNNIQNPNFNDGESQLDLLFPIKES